MSNRFIYRPDIDGLRAVAVLLVVFFHANFSWLTGGFIGVDVFFVLSGFLITFIIEKEISQNNFSFQQFYLRRIRRIIPVLFFILLIFTIPAYFMLAEDFVSYARTFINTIFCSNNFYLWSNNRQYFKETTELMPLLHTWSLSVEEQFYFIWPSLLLLLHRIKSVTLKSVMVLLLLIIGFIISVYLTKTDQNTAYFLLPGRIFELGIGATLAIFWYSLPKVNKNTNHLLSIIGILLIFIPAILLNKASEFPGLNAFWPCFGTAILIFTNKENDSNRGIINTLLSNRFFVSIGLISYSMYLWHWPIFSFIKYFGINIDGTVRIVAIASIFLVSYFSWKFIEVPFRTTLKFNFKNTLLYFMLPVLAITAIIYGIVDNNDGFPNRYPDVLNPQKNFIEEIRKKCYDRNIVGNCKECFLGIKKDTLNGLLIGDSYANHAAPFLDVLAKDANFYIHDSSHPGIALLRNVDENNKPIDEEEFGLKRLNFAKKFKTIFIASNWNVLTNSETNRNLILNTIADLLKLKKNIVIIDCLRELPEMKYHKLKLNVMYPEYYNEDFTIAFQKRPYNYLVYEIKRQFPSVIVIDMNQGVKVNNNRFTTKINDSFIYKNKDHLNYSGSKSLGQKYLLTHKNPLKEIK